MPIADLGDVTLCYETHGRRGDPAIVLIRGLGTQLIDWPAALVDGLVREGLEVVVFDNRDAGLSSEMTDLAGDPPYRLEAMADDTIGLLDSLGIERAHILGISLGGMIAQHVALRHPSRVVSLISVMSSTGNPDIPAPAPEIRARLVETAATPDALIALNAENREVFGSPGFPEPLAERPARSTRPISAATVRRRRRQMRAAIADGSRVERLRTLQVRTLVIHGADDPLIPVAAGRDTAAAIPGALLEIVPGMGHNIPETLAPQIVAIVAGFIQNE
jgi:proline iminopeptidase